MGGLSDSVTAGASGVTMFFAAADLDVLLTSRRV